MKNKPISIFEGASINAVVDGKHRFITFHVFLTPDLKKCGLGFSYCVFPFSRHYEWSVSNTSYDATLIAGLKILQEIHTIATSDYSQLVLQAINTADNAVNYRQMGPDAEALKDRVPISRILCLTNEKENARSIRLLSSNYQRYVHPQK